MLLMPSNLFLDAEPPPISKRTGPGVPDGETLDDDSTADGGNSCKGWAVPSNLELGGSPRRSLTVTSPGLDFLALLGRA